MFSRYDGRQILKNASSLYKEHFRERGVKFVKSYDTPILRYPTAEEIAEFTIVTHTWGVGSAAWKLAQIHYGDPVLWYVICFYNEVFSEVEFKVGQTVYVPLPLEKVLRSFGL